MVNGLNRIINKLSIQVTYWNKIDFGFTDIFCFLLVILIALFLHFGKFIA